MKRVNHMDGFHRIMTTIFKMSMDARNYVAFLQKPDMMENKDMTEKKKIYQKYQAYLLDLMIQITTEKDMQRLYNSITGIYINILKDEDLSAKDLDDKDLDEKDLNEKDLDEKDLNDKDLNVKDLKYKDIIYDKDLPSILKNALIILIHKIEHIIYVKLENELTNGGKRRQRKRKTFRRRRANSKKRTGFRRRW